MAVLQDKVVLITGASSGIGRACAQVFAQAGAKLSLAARRLDRLQTLATELGGKSMIAQVDVSKHEEVNAWVTESVERFGRVDILINNAGVGCLGKIADVDLALARQVFDINLFGPLYGIQAVVPVMRKQGSGHIINISSVVGKRSIPDIGMYCATKFALNAMGDALRLEVAKQNITVTTVCPGLTETEFVDATLRPARTRAPQASFKGQSAEEVARHVLRAVQRKSREIHLTKGGRMLVQIERFSPRLADFLVSFRSAVYK